LGDAAKKESLMIRASPGLEHPVNHKFVKKTAPEGCIWEVLQNPGGTGKQDIYPDTACIGAGRRTNLKRELATGTARGKSIGKGEVWEKRGTGWPVCCIVKGGSAIAMPRLCPAIRIKALLLPPRAGRAGRLLRKKTGRKTEVTAVPRKEPNQMSIEGGDSCSEGEKKRGEKEEGSDLGGKAMTETRSAVPEEAGPLGQID